MGGASISGDSVLTPSSQAFSPMTLGDEAGGSAHYHRQTNHAHSEGYVTSGEGGVSDLQYNSSVSKESVHLCMLKDLSFIQRYIQYSVGQNQVSFIQRCPFSEVPE